MSRGALLAVGLLLGVMAAHGLSGCMGPGVSVTRAFSGLGNMMFGPPSSREFPRFREAYAARSDGDPAFLEHFGEAFDRVREDYVHPVDEASLIDAAIRGLADHRPEDGGPVTDRALAEAALDAMMSELDPHSSYLGPEELNELKVSTRGRFGGLGIQVTMDKDSGWVKVISPIDDTPAYRTGIRSGDLISRLDGKPVDGMTLGDAVRVMRGEPGTRITVTIHRADRDPFDVTIERAIVEVNPVKWRAEGDIGYIRVSSFSEKVDDGVIEALAALRGEIGAGRLRGYVLDLRNNPGGLLRQAVLLADAFLDDGVVVSVRGRDTTGTRTHRAAYGDLARGKPLVVLVNGGSASAAEIVAAALQDNRRAVVMGARTFGKGSVQVVSPLELEGALRLTTDLYYVPSGRTIQALGVQPDIVLERPDEDPGVAADAAAPDDGAAAATPLPRREADLPHALIVEDGETRQAARATVPRAACPAAGEDGEDRSLGCALSYLRLGSEASFLSAMRAEAAALR